VASSDGKRIYAANSNSPALAVIDTVTDTLLATINTATTGTAGYPISMTITPDGSKIFVGVMGDYRNPDRSNQGKIEVIEFFFWRGPREFQKINKWS
jgi:YVTN family beta-propeller protein